jgi:tetratricopeptide (TPR) repeat protein
MLKPKKRITKKEIKEDRLVTTYFEAQSWFEQNRKRVSSIFFGVLLAGIAAWFYFNNVAGQNRSATADLGKIIRYYDDGRYQLAISGSPQQNLRGLQQIVDEFGGTEAGERATFYLANSYFGLGNYEKALQYYQETSLKDNSLMAAVTAGIGACYEAKGNHQEAAGYFEKAASDDALAYHSAENLYRAGRNYLLAGNPERAGEILRKLKTSYPSSAYAREADRLLVLVPKQG